MNESARHDRYPGARPFMDTDIDHRLFFGRDREINKMFYQVLGARLLVLFGKSGLGKTSLLQAGVFPRLREQELLPLPVRLNRTDLPPLELFTTAIAEACAQAGIDYTPGETGSLWEFFKTAVFWRGEALQTPVLVLDQFEEIFTLQSAANRQWLARQLGELAGDGLPQSLRARLQPGEKLPYSEKPPTVKIVLSLREDYLGALQELSGEIPRILENRFRLTTMSREQARAAVLEPARLAQEGAFAAQPFDYEESAVEELLTFLSGRTGEIEPFQLQILCRQVEQQVAAAQAKGQQAVHVDKEYLGGRTRMEAILQNFYLDAVRRLPSRRRRNRARDLCEEGLLDSQGHRRILEEKDIQERYKVDTTSLQALVDARLLRKEERQEVFYYELSHDSLTQPVLNSRRWRMPRQLKIGLWIVVGIAAVVLGVFQWEKQQAEAYARVLEATTEKAKKARAEAERILDYLVFDLRDKLAPVGRLDLVEDVEKQVNAYYERMGVEEENAEVMRRRAAAYHSQGNRLLAQGNLEGALQAYQAGLTIAEALAQRDPSNTEWQRDLSVSHEKIGDVRSAQGDLAGALQAYQAGLTIREALAQRDPSNTEWQRDLSVSHDRIGDVRSAQGELAGALQAYQADLKIAEALAQRDPSNTEWRRDLSVSHEKIGDVRSAQGELAGALQAYQSGLTIREALAQRDPSNTEWQRDLSISHNKLGDVRAAQGELAGALQAYQSGLTIAEALAQRDPSNTQWRRDLSVSHEKIGDVRAAQGELAGALQAYQSGLKIREALAQRDPSNATWQLDLVVSFYKLASVTKQSGKKSDQREARNYYEQSLTILRRLEKEGRLPPNRKEWIEIIEKEMKALGN